jgi:hypothetical protein
MPTSDDLAVQRIDASSSRVGAKEEVSVPDSAEAVLQMERDWSLLGSVYRLQEVLVLAGVWLCFALEWCECSCFGQGLWAQRMPD